MDAKLLDDLSGFEFEEVMADVFRHMGFENVQKSRKTGDEGRDIVMKERTSDGSSTTVIVECKHTQKVSRPVVQKLHSAVTTYPASGPKRGIVVTTGRFTGPAKDYAKKLRENSSGEWVELINGSDLREIGEEVGLDIYNGKIEVLCDETLEPPSSREQICGVLRDEFDSVSNFDATSISDHQLGLQLRPVLHAKTHVNAVFETTVGVIHSVNKLDDVLFIADRGKPEPLQDSVKDLALGNRSRLQQIDEDHLQQVADIVKVDRFGMTETDYKNWIVEAQRQWHRTTVTYTGDNNVTYNKTCIPNQSDIAVRDIASMYLPEVDTNTRIIDYSYSFDFFAVGNEYVASNDGIHQCVHCGTSNRSNLTFCDNCGSINCATHTKTERLVEEPICTGCAVTESFFFKEKYFYNEGNLREFGEVYEEMPFYKKPLENPALVAAVTTASVLLVAALFYYFPI